MIYSASVFVEILNYLHQGPHLFRNIRRRDLCGRHAGDTHSGLIRRFSKLVPHSLGHSHAGFLCGIGGKGLQTILQKHDLLMCAMSTASWSVNTGTAFDL